MVKYFSKFKVILALILIILLVILLISACDIGGGQQIPSGPSTFGILAPAESAKVLVSSPVQIQSAFENAGAISRVELLVREPGAETDKLLRADVPTDGVVLQEWFPQQVGPHTIRVIAYNANNDPISELTREIEASLSPEISLSPPEPVVTETPPEAAAFEPVTPTPTPVLIEAAPTEIITTRTAPVDTSQVSEPEVVIAVAAVEPSPTPTPILRFPPPPPAPGVPPGPTQANLPELTPPVCDAAKYVGVYASDTSRRVVITEDDDVPAKVVGGAIVFRGWRLQNVGTCTWGPGYELAFYGGRAMGSGGVAFESTFPAEPARRNALLDANRLIVPEGKPNQTAVVEVLLNAPVTPGIHQSYWRMRNPHGVFFGPIVGVTMEVVRECTAGIYGAPVINKFEILGVGNVYQPTDPVNVIARFGENITLDWNIINATNFDIVFEDPTGDIQSISTPDQSGRATFPAKELGRHVITLYADNGACTVRAQVNVDVVPPEDEQFELDIILSSSTAAANSSRENVSISSSLDSGNVTAEWRHFDQNTDKFVLIAQRYSRQWKRKCPLVDSIFGWKGHCYYAWGEWQPDGPKVERVVGDEGDAQGAATVTNLESGLCRVSTDKEQYRLVYILRAEKEGTAASPEYSNTVVTECGTLPSTDLPVEMD